MRSDVLWKQWGEWFAEERKSRRMSQREVADKADMERTHISDLENGKSGAKRDTVIQLAEAVGLDVNEALTRAGFVAEPAARPNSQVMEIDRRGKVTYIGDLAPEDAEMINNMAEKIRKSYKARE